jgi:hypothetical protein
MSQILAQVVKKEAPPTSRRRKSRSVRHSKSLFLYIARGLLLNCAMAFIVLEAVQGIIFTIRATEGFSFDVLIIFPVLLRAFGQAVSYTLPISLLFGTGLFVGRLNADREILASQSFGVSAAQLLLPVVVVGGVSSLASYYLNNQWVPFLRLANRNVGTFVLDQLGYLGEGWNFEFSSGSVSLWIYHYEGPVLEGVFLSVSDTGSGAPISREVLSKVNALSYQGYLFAERGFAYRGKGELEGHLVVELQGVNVFFDDDFLQRSGSSDFMQRAHANRWRWIPSFEKKMPSSKDMDWAELSSETQGRYLALLKAKDGGSEEELEEARRGYAGAVTEFHRRISLSLSALTFPLSAFVLGLFVISSNRLLPFFLSSILVPALYFTFELVGNNLGKRGICPWALEHAGNAALVILCAILLWRAGRGPRA